MHLKKNLLDIISTQTYKKPSTELVNFSDPGGSGNKEKRKTRLIGYNEYKGSQPGSQGATITPASQNCERGETWGTVKPWLIWI